MSSEVVTIFDELKQHIRDVLSETNGVSIDRNGFYYSECYKDYRDELQEDTIAEILNDSNPMSKFEDHLQWAYCDAMIDFENDILDALKDNKDIIRIMKNFNISDDSLRDYLCEVWYVNPPYKDFLKQEVCMDVFLDTGDGNYEFTVNNLTAAEKVEDFDENSSLLWLCKQQGVNEAELFAAIEKGSVHSDEVLNLRNEKERLTEELKKFGFKTPHFNESVIHTGTYWQYNKLQDELQKNENMLKKLNSQYKLNDISYDEYLKTHHEKYAILTPVTEEKFNDKKSEILNNLSVNISETESNIERLKTKIGSNYDFDTIKVIQSDLFNVSRRLQEIAKSDDYKKAQFIDSVINEINNTYGMSAVTFLVKMPLEQAIKLQEIINSEKEVNNSYHYEERKGMSSITIDKDVTCGLMDTWNGGGSVFEIKLLKDVDIPVKAVYDFEVDAAVKNYGFMNIYGTNDEFYKDSLKAVHEIERTKVNELISDATVRSKEDNKDATNQSLSQEFDDNQTEKSIDF